MRLCAQTACTPNCYVMETGAIGAAIKTEILATAKPEQVTSYKLALGELRLSLLAAVLRHDMICAKCGLVKNIFTTTEN